MKTIEERAEEYAIKVSPYPQDRGATYDTATRKAYLKGATEQKAIDDDHLREVKKKLIDRAYSWLVHNLDDDRAFVVWRDFKKFMMEE